MLLFHYIWLAGAFHLTFHFHFHLFFSVFEFYFILFYFFISLCLAAALLWLLLQGVDLLLLLPALANEVITDIAESESESESVIP